MICVNNRIPGVAAIDAQRQRGSSIVEVLVAMSLFSIVAVGLAQSAAYSLRFQKSAELGNLARNLAVSKAEELAGVSLADLDDSFDGTESNLTVVGHSISFDRVTDVTVNADGSRTVDIVVSSPSPLLFTAVTYSTRFAPWES